MQESNELRHTAHSPVPLPSCDYFLSITYISHIALLILSTQGTVWHLAAHLLHQHTDPHFISLISVLKFNTEFRQLHPQATRSHVFLTSSKKASISDSQHLQAVRVPCCHIQATNHNTLCDCNVWKPSQAHGDHQTTS